ncbi:MAG: polyprenyl synthetase family protein [Nitrosopumilaceae archaeon]|nr:polyprenyl synthetase family protein [Nitrosopumilaceae archaeon]
MKRTARAVDAHLTRSLAGSPDELYRAARHLIIHGGKRLRPYMVIKSCQMLGGSVADARRAASAVEMVHNFTLLHDDIMDNDDVRHGVPTVHKRFGVPVAILAGDILFSKAYQTLAGRGGGRGGARPDAPKRGGQTHELVSRLASACVDVCEGQMLDIKMAEAKRLPSQKEYITMIGKKTAVLFDVSCAMGAVCAGAGASDVKNLSWFGRSLGIAFQITDDLIGVTGDASVTKKPVGNDIREGKKSLPILMAIKASSGTKHRRIISSAFGNSRASRSMLDSAVESVRELGVEEKARKMAMRHAERARGSLASYPNRRARKELEALLDFVVKRSV